MTYSRRAFVRRLLDALEDSPHLLAATTEVRSADLSRSLNAPDFPRWQGPLGADDAADLVGEAGCYLSFIDTVVLRRATWLARPRSKYYGTFFITSARCRRRRFRLWL